MKIKLLYAAAAIAVVPVGVKAQSSFLHYDAPATYFEEALPIGNGTIGAMVYGGTFEDKLTLNDITLWTGEPDKKVYSPEAYKAIPEIREVLFREDYRTPEVLQKKVQGHYSENYQPLGTLLMTDIRPAVVSAANYRRTLDLETAVANVSYEGFKREYFASAPDSVIVIRLTAEGNNKINKRFRYTCQLPHITTETSKNGVSEIINDGYAAYNSKPGYCNVDEYFFYDSNRGIHFRTIVHIEQKDGKASVVNNDEIEVSDCSEVIVTITNVTSFNGFDKDPVKEGRDYKTISGRIIKNASKRNYSDILSDHISDYSKLYGKIAIDLGTTNENISRKSTVQQLKDYTANSETNPDLEELYFNFGRYLLISCSRTKDVPANLQGLWNESMLPPWSSNYTVNINTQENYWPSEPAGLGDLHESLIGFIEKLSVSGHQTAKSYYGVNEGWCAGHNTDIWAMSCPVGEHTGNPVWANWNMAGTWLCMHLWEHYAFTNDIEYLKKIWPVLKGSADFCMGWLVEKDGYLLTAPSTSPENIYLTDSGFGGSTLYGGTADIAFIRECLQDAMQAANVLREDETYILKLKNTLDKLLPYRIGKNGNLQEWYHDWRDNDPVHRHQSHLAGLFPGHQITVARTPDLAAACSRTLEIKGSESTGWSTGWRISLQARLLNSEKAYKTYRRLLKYISPEQYEGSDKIRGGGTYANLFDAHSPFQIDGNFGGCAGVMEMLVQSTFQDGKTEITLLPALPSKWAESGTVRGIHTRGGYVLDFSWKNGKISSLTLKDIRPEYCRKTSCSIIEGKSSRKIATVPGQSIKVK